MMPGETFVIRTGDLQIVIAALAARGYLVLGPTLRDGAIIYDRISNISELPRGWTDRQDAGTYRLEKRSDDAFFGYALGPRSWKQFLLPPHERVLEVRRSESGLTFTSGTQPAKLAFLGARSCELHAIAIQDKVLLDGPYRDGAYAARRHENFFVAVNCAVAGGTCFCSSMGTGPKAQGGFDLALTELSAAEFLVEIGSDAGAELFAHIPHRAARDGDLAAADAIIAETAAHMGRTLKTDGLKEVLQANPEHPRWDEVASRCLSCANCTMVCPTCFCTTVEDHSDLSGETASRDRRWDSCFTLDFSYLHGGSVRNTPRARYRQWMTHKLASWIDQFGSSGCVGCGRCIAWCPVAIDITEEAAAIRATDVRARPQPKEAHGDD